MPRVSPKYQVPIDQVLCGSSSSFDLMLMRAWFMFLHPTTPYLSCMY